MRRVVTPLALAACLLLAACQADEPADPATDLAPVDDVPGTTAEPQDDGPGTVGDPIEDETTDVDDGDADPQAGPQPDEALLADPCGPHQGREGEGFIDVVSPVDEQRLSGPQVTLVGCSNVHEATVSWTLYDGDGRELDAGFTTAECGTGCVGAFEEVLDLSSAAGEPFAELHVYSEDVSDGGGQLHLTAIPLVLG